MQVAKLVHCYNMDARRFLRDLAAKGTLFHHALMNLPVAGVEFLGRCRLRPGTSHAAPFDLCVAPAVTR